MNKSIIILAAAMLFSCNDNEEERDGETMKDTANDIAVKVSSEALQTSGEYAEVLSGKM